MSPMLERIHQSPGGSELLDVLIKYLYVARLLQTRILQTKGTYGLLMDY